jgi:hypothetical protein
VHCTTSQAAKHAVSPVPEPCHHRETPYGPHTFQTVSSREMFKLEVCPILLTATMLVAGSYIQRMVNLVSLGSQHACMPARHNICGSQPPSHRSLLTSDEQHGHQIQNKKCTAHYVSHGFLVHSPGMWDGPSSQVSHETHDEYSVHIMHTSTHGSTVWHTSKYAYYECTQRLTNECQASAKLGPSSCT